MASAHPARWTAAGILLLCSVLTTAARAREPDPYRLDPVTDSVIVALTAVSSLGSEVTVQSGELQASAPGPIHNIPLYDRWVAESAARSSASPLSDVGVGLALGYAAFDSVRAGARSGPRAGFTAGVLYLETTLLNWTLVNLVKLAVRRPRPRAYYRQYLAPPDDDRHYAPDHGGELSFYSGHTAMTAGIGGTAAYLAFEREGDSAYAWSVLALGTAVTTLVAINRIRARAHFPSDVFVGAIVGAAIGVLVPHLHRRTTETPSAVSASTQPLAAGGFTLRF